MSSNVMIILLNLRGTYVGGAQRRYINLFRYFQEAGMNQYYLLVNNTLYNSIIQDGLLQENNNLFKIRVFGEIDKKDAAVDRVAVKGKKIKKGLVFRLKRLKSLLKGFYSCVLYSFNLKRIIREKNIKAVYSVFQGGIYSWIILRLLRIYHVYSYNDASNYMVQKGITDLFRSEYFVLKNCDRIDFLSEKVAKNTQKVIGKLDDSRFNISPSSFVDTERFTISREKKRRVVFMSRLVHLKNPMLFLESVKVLQAKYSLNDVQYDIIGNGKLLNEMKNYCKINGINSIIFHGAIAKPEKILSESIIFVSIQQDNNYPSQALMEAMSCGNVIVASDVGETDLLVNNETGILVSFDPDSIAKAIYGLLSDEQICLSMGIAGREKILKEHSVSNYADYFTKLINNE